MKIERLVLVGDCHADFKKLGNKLKYLSDATVFVLGDWGQGFYPPDKENRMLDELDQVCREQNIDLKAGRGNHDIKSLFEKSNYIRPNIELITDYSYFEFNGKQVLWVGGAISVDRADRKEGLDYWPDETFILEPEKVKKVDILLTHTGSSWLGPFNKRGIVGAYMEKDANLWEDLKKERYDIDKLIELSQPSQLYCGHFHLRETNTVNGCTGRILDILELLEIK